MGNMSLMAKAMKRFFPDPYVSGIAFYRRPHARTHARARAPLARRLRFRVRVRLSLLMAAGLGSWPETRLALGVAPGFGPRFLA